MEIMSIHIFNTLTNEKELFKPLEENKVKMYLCGPTVYNYIHIGNARPAIVFDTVRKYFEYKGYEVNFISNFTDVDDKIIQTALELNEEVGVLTERFIEAYLSDLSDLGCEKATKNPKVSEHIQDIVSFIQVLIEKGYAYESNGDVYFRSKKFDGYGKLSNKKIDDLIAGSRIEVNEQKEDPIDFALWKAAKPGEINWESPFGKGRPGWHIECSVMARQHLGDTIDIHAGGIDLTFPHHENEIAQSEAHNDKTFANYWMHNGHITVNQTKMSKSLGNFLLVKELKEKIDPLVLRYFLLSTHYRQPLDYGTELIEKASYAYKNIQVSEQLLDFAMSYAVEGQNELEKEIKEVMEDFEKDMDDDFNTPNAISSLHRLETYSNVYVAENPKATIQTIQAIKEAKQKLLKVLGLEKAIEKEEKISDEEKELIEHLVAERDAAKKDKDFKKADEIRNRLKEKNIVLEDTRQGTRWYIGK